MMCSIGNRESVYVGSRTSDVEKPLAPITVVLWSNY